MDKKKIITFIEEHLFEVDHYASRAYSVMIKSLSHLQSEGGFYFDPPEIEFIKNFVQYFTTTESGPYLVTMIKMLHLSKGILESSVGMENFRTMQDIERFVKFCAMFDISVSLCEIYDSVAVQLKIRR